MTDKNIHNRNIKVLILLIGIIGILIGITLMLISTIPSLSHEVGIDIILYAFLFGGIGLLCILLFS